MYQGKVDVDMLNTVKSVLADVLSVSSDEGPCRREPKLVLTGTSTPFYCK